MVVRYRIARIEPGIWEDKGIFLSGFLCPPSLSFCRVSTYYKMGVSRDRGMTGVGGTEDMCSTVMNGTARTTQPAPPGVRPRLT